MISFDVTRRVHAFQGEGMTCLNTPTKDLALADTINRNELGKPEEEPYKGSSQGPILSKLMQSSAPFSGLSQIPFRNDNILMFRT